MTLNHNTMKTTYLPPSMTVYALSLENHILELSGNGDAPSFDGYSGENLDWNITTNGSL